MEIVDSVDKTKRDYEKLLKSVLEEIENNQDGEPIYQGQRLDYLSRNKWFIKDHCILVIENILACYQERYWGNLDGVIK